MDRSQRTHFETQRGFLNSALPRARTMVRKLGWKALPVWLFSPETMDGMSRTDARDRDNTDNPFVLLHSALNEAIIEHATTETEDPYSLAQVTRTRTISEFAAWCINSIQNRSVTANNDANTANAETYVTTMVTQIWHQVSHERAGKRVYEVSPGLGERLANTELRGLHTDDVRAPFKSVYVMVPPSAGLKIYNDDTEWHRCIGFYVTEDEHSDSRVGLEPGTERSWRVMAVGESKNDNPWDDALIYFSVHFPPGMLLTKALDLELDQNVERKSFKTTEGHAFYQSEWRKLFNWVLNVLIYATWPDAERFETLANPEARHLKARMDKHPKGSNKHEKAKEQFRNLDPCHRIVLGRSVPRWTPEEKGEHREGTPLSMRVLVQGHWKRIVYGEGRALRRWGFIEPFWRGKEDLPTSEGRHVLV
jgi:hypothetical protein